MSVPALLSVARRSRQYGDFRTQNIDLWSRLDSDNAPTRILFVMEVGIPVR
jgi:hypothetical protein